MERRKTNATFLEKLIEFRFALGTICAVFEPDEALAALARTGFSREALEDTACKFARPRLVELLDKLRACMVLNFPHGEQQVMISMLIRSIEHVITSLAVESEPDNLRRILALALMT